MNNQGNNAQNSSFKIIFSNILCKINIIDSSLFGFVIRIGKTSSRYTQKKQIHQSIIKFDDVLQIPVDQRLLANQNGKKQKCEIMLYKFRINRQKQCKQLVGMASVAISNDMFDEQVKKLRLTNSFDKEAFVQCRMKIELGQADVLQHNESKLSSFNIRSQQPSMNQLAQSRKQQKNQILIKKQNQVKIGLITSNSRKSLHQNCQDKNKSDNSFLQLLIGNQNDLSPKIEPIKSQNIISRHDYQSNQLLDEQHYSNKDLQDQNAKLNEICKNLQQQNQLLINKINNNTENPLLNQSIISNRSASSQNPNIPRPPGYNSKKSPMIKKNTTITITPSFSRLHATGNILTQDITNTVNQQQNGLKQIKKNQISQGGVIKSQSRVKTLNQQDPQNSPYFSKKGSEVAQQNLKTPQQNIQPPIYLTFAGEANTQRNPKLSLQPVIQIKYAPKINPGNSDVSYDKDNSIINGSISQAERRNCRSYTKFTGKRKYQIVAAIRSPDQSQINMSYDQDLQMNNRREGGSIILSKPPLQQKNGIDKSFHQKNKNTKQSPYNIFKAQEAQDNKPFLDFLKQKQQIPIIKNTNNLIAGVTSPKASHSSLPYSQDIFHGMGRKQQQADADGQVKSRLTLQELDIKTEQKFRKNQRALKVANMKILQENKTLKTQRKTLEDQVQLKKQLSHEEFQRMKNQIGNLRQKIDESTKVKEQSEQKITEITKKYSYLQEQNLKLKKDLKQQKSKYEYYFKMSNINDDKQKERDPINPNQNSFLNKKSSNKLNSQNSSPIDYSKIIGKSQKPITSILNLNNKEDSNKSNASDKNLAKKVDFSIEKKVQDYVKIDSFKKTQSARPDIPKSNSSAAISKLKMHIKPIIPKSPVNGNEMFSQIHSPQSQISNDQGVANGLVGTGQTIIRDVQKPNNFFSKK